MRALDEVAPPPELLLQKEGEANQKRYRRSTSFFPRFHPLAARDTCGCDRRKQLVRHIERLTNSDRALRPSTFITAR